MTTSVQLLQLLTAEKQKDEQIKLLINEFTLLERIATALDAAEAAANAGSDIEITVGGLTATLTASADFLTAITIAQNKVISRQLEIETEVTGLL